MASAANGGGTKIIVRAGFIDRILDRVEHRQADMQAAALARGDAPDQLGAVVERLFGVERALLAGEALANDLCGFVYKYTH
jgi:hypothetical protein